MNKPRKNSPFSSEAVANYLLDLAEAERVRLTPMKLVKLVYIAHGWYLAIKDQPLIDDKVEAWQYGPVVPDVYHSFKRFGGREIDSRATGGSWLDGFAHLPLDQSADDARQIIRKVWDVYGRFTGPQLMSLTHKAGTPWYQVWHDKGGCKRRHVDIDDHVIKKHFVEKVNERNATAR